MTGHWNAYFLAQSGRGHSVNDPLGTLRFAKAATLSFVESPARHDLVQYVQTILVVLVVGSTAVVLVWQLARGRAPAADLRAGLLVILLWLTPLVVGGLSLYRTDAALLPSVVVLRRLPVVGVIVLAVLATPVAYWLDVLFFQHRLA